MQARADYANMTIIRGDTGLIIVDPLMARETAAAALEVVNETLGERPVSAIIITHTHPDHLATRRYDPLTRSRSMPGFFGTCRIRGHTWRQSHVTTCRLSIRNFVVDWP